MLRTGSNDGIAIHLSFYLTDILTAILYGTMFSSDIASAAFRVASSLRKQQIQQTKKIDFLRFSAVDAPGATG